VIRAVGAQRRDHLPQDRRRRLARRAGLSRIARALINYLQKSGRSDDARRFLAPLAKAFGDLLVPEITLGVLDEHIRRQPADQAAR
jgi:hypothetical protein